MKTNYKSLWCLLAVALAVLTILSAFSPVTIGSYELKDSGIFESMVRPMEDVDASTPSEGMPLIDTVETEHVPVPIDTTAKTILFIGDSMLEGLSPRLAAYAQHNGHKLYSVMWYSSTSKVWGNSDKLTYYINRYKPDFVFISLGANELFVKDIAKKRDKYVKAIVDDLGDIPYLWIGPPNWKPDTGINQLIAENTGQGGFFLSDGMKFNRASDGAHPTRSSAIEWMDSVIRWMPAHSLHPFRMEVPTSQTAKPERIHVHQPSEK